MKTEQANLQTTIPVELSKCSVGIAVFNAQYGLCIVTDRTDVKERMIVNLNTGVAYWVSFDTWFIVVETVVKYDGNSVASCQV